MSYASGILIIQIPRIIIMTGRQVVSIIHACATSSETGYFLLLTDQSYSCI